jgi:hypothetical protein
MATKATISGVSQDQPEKTMAAKLMLKGSWDGRAALRAAFLVQWRDRIASLAASQLFIIASYQVRIFLRHGIAVERDQAVGVFKPRDLLSKPDASLGHGHENLVANEFARRTAAILAVVSPENPDALTDSRQLISKIRGIKDLLHFPHAVGPVGVSCSCDRIIGAGIFTGRIAQLLHELT